MSPQVSGPTRDVPRRLLTGGAAPAGVVLAVTGIISLAVSGAGAAGSALAGGLLALAAFAVGPVLMHLGRDFSPAGLQAAALGGYLVVVFALAVGYVLLDTAGWFAGTPAGVGVLTVSAAWLAGQLRRTVRLRMLAFGEETGDDGTQV